MRMSPSFMGAARRLGIDYLYVDKTERSAYPAVAKFDRYPVYFTPVFKNAEAAVYALRPMATMSEAR